MTQPVAVPPEDIREVIEMPAGYEAIGALTVNCRDSKNSDASAVLDTIDECRLERMVDALRKKASRVGGEMLVHRTCDTDYHATSGHDGRLVSSERMSCRAVVARRIALGNAGSTHGIPNSEVPRALRGAPTPTRLDPAVIEATKQYEPDATAETTQNP